MTPRKLLGYVILFGPLIWLLAFAEQEKIAMMALLSLVAIAVFIFSTWLISGGDGKP